MNNTVKALVHGAVSVILFAIPLVMMGNAPWMDLTIGGVLNVLYHGLLLWNTTKA